MAKQASGGPAPFSGHSATSRASNLWGQFLFTDFHGAIKAGQSGKNCAILPTHERAGPRIANTGRNVGHPHREGDWYLVIGNREEQKRNEPLMNADQEH